MALQCWEVRISTRSSPEQLAMEVRQVSLLMKHLMVAISAMMLMVAIAIGWVIYPLCPSVVAHTKLRDFVSQGQRE